MGDQIRSYGYAHEGANGVGGYLLSAGLSQPDRAWPPPVSDAGLRWRVMFSGQELTYTCAKSRARRRLLPVAA